MNTEEARTELGFTADETLSEKKVKDAFREKSKEYHPDASDHPNARERFLNIKQARKVLLADETVASSKTSSTTSQSNSSATETADQSSTSRTNTTSSSSRSSTSSSGNSSTSSSNQSSESSSSRSSTRSRSWRNNKVDWSSGADGDAEWRDQRAGSSTRSEGTNRTSNDFDQTSTTRTGTNTSKTGTETSETGTETSEAETETSETSDANTYDPDNRVHENWRSESNGQTESDNEAHGNESEAPNEYISPNTISAQNIRDRYKAHRQERDWTPHYVGEGGYLGVETFPQRPTGRSRLIHLLVVFFGLIATALLGRGQYIALKNATEDSPAVEPKATVQNVFLVPAKSVLALTPFRLVSAVSFLRFPRVYLPVLGGILAPYIINRTLADLSIAEAAGAATAGSGVLMAGVALGRYNSSDSTLPISSWWAENQAPEYTWGLGGALLLLLAHAATAAVAEATVGLYYDAFLLYAVAVAPFVPIILLMSFMSPPKILRYPGMALLGTVILIPVFGIVTHHPEFKEIMFGTLLFGEGYYPATSGYRTTGAIMSIWAVSWHLLAVAALELLCVGWEVSWHKQSKEQPLPYTVWGAVTAAGLGVTIWGGLQVVRGQMPPETLHTSLVAGMILFAYIYGVVVDPIVE
ncbi:J domain-containing protein [Haloarcula marismortui]|uniref:J domain-containing protein n=1 Tax=Haloarcula marismortui TaxID=2238 RepID=UPI000322CE64|nr:J domain-containing protein [Haloarcula californiae]